MKTKLALTVWLAIAAPLLAAPRPDRVPRGGLDLPPDLVEPGLDGRGLIDPKDRAVGFLGVSAFTVPAAMADRLRIDHGVALTRIVPKSPAEKAGLKANDVILEVNEKKIATMMDLSEAIRAHREGDRVTLQVMQDGKKVEKRVTLAAAPPLPPGFAGGGIGGMRMRVFPGGGLQMDWNDGNLRVRDEEGSVEVKGSGEGREVTVRDLDNEITFEGPWVTPQDKAAAPPGIRRRIETATGMFGGNGFGVRRFPVPPQRVLPLPPPPPPAEPAPLVPLDDDGLDLGGPFEVDPEETPEKDE